MAPTESHHGMIPVMGTQVPLTGTIPLSTLIEFIIQRTYQDLSILSELLPRKTDMDRKIEIVQFASRTCQLFVRLLALVKWANNASKVDKCAMISNFLDQQAKLFEKTADSLAVMARETLTHARLPSFSLPCAVDVLTTGSYPRLPTCIKEKIVPPDPITPQEKWQTLMRLNQIIEHRLVTSDLPKHMRRPQIQNGRVSFQVEHEFEVTLTLMGDGPNIPWRLLLIEILVEDPETGDGKSLVHSLQVNYLHQLVQMRIMDSKKPLHDLYNCLHSFCQSLQLEVLHSQTQQLMRQRLGDHIHIEEYKAGEKLVISYWRDLMRKENKSYSSTTFKLSVHMDTNDPSRPLQITHFPLIHGTQSLMVAQAIKSDYLSIERLLVHTIHVRSLAKLKELQKELRLILSGQFKISDLPLVLYVPVISPCMDSEKICVSVHMQNGTFLISVCRTETSLTVDIEDSLNGDRRDLRKLLSRLRLSLVLSRCTKSIQHLQVTTSHHLPLVNLSGHPLEKLGKHKIFIKLAKQSDYYMVVEAFERGWMSVDFNHYLMHVTLTGFEGAASDGEGAEDSPCVYLRAGYFMQLDTYLCTHGPCSQLQELEEEEPDPLSRKRKMFMKDQYGRHTKKQKCSPYFVPELCHILALCEDRIPFVALADELLKQGIPHQGLQVDGDGAALCLTLVDVLSCPLLKDNEAVQLMKTDLLSCKFRKAGRVWKVESVVANCPLQSTNSKEQGVIQRVYFEYELQGSETMEKIVEGLQEDWLAVCHLYQVVSDFAHIYAEKPALQAGIEVKTFTYKRLTLAYGPNKCYTVSIQYQPTSKRFQLAYGTCCKSNVANCHSMVAVQLESLLNDSHSIALLAQILVDTWSPLSSIGKLNTSPVMGLGKIMGMLVANFLIIPQSPVHIRLIFRNLYCIDIHCNHGNEVTLRDGAYSMFDTSKVVEGLNPTTGLKAFLNMYVDETVSSSHIRHQSTTEDDNPPSPIGIDTLDSLLSQPLSNSPVATRKQDGGLRFQSPITPPSNPHTPASPSTQRHGQTHSSPGAASFPLASPPSMTHGIAPSPSNIMAPSPNNPALHVPSPSAFVPAPSPQSLGIHMPSPATQFISPQGMLEGVGSPFASGSTQLAMPSPGARNWPASPSMPGPSPVSRSGGMLSPVHTALHSPQMQLKDDYQKGSLSMLPSRMLPQRSWAGSIPTVLTHDALNKLLSPSFPPGSSAVPSVRCCPLERFLCCMYQRKFLQRTIQTEENLQMMQCSEPGVLMFKTDQLQFRVSLNPNTLQSLHLTVTPAPEYQNHWELDELQILERFFDFKVACPPYKINTLMAFSSRILCSPTDILKDFIKIMRMELLPDRSLKWSVQWCLTVPLGTAYPVGVPAVTLSNSRVLFMIQLTRIGVAMPPGVEPQNIVIPILYDHNMNTTQVMEQRSPEQNQTTLAVNNMLKRFTELNPNRNGCSIFPALKELLTNLVVPMPGMNQPQ